jgi:hypothetical protein
VNWLSTAPDRGVFLPALDEAVRRLAVFNGRVIAHCSINGLPDGVFGDS